MLPSLVLLAAIAGVPEHAHCEMCGRPVAVGERRCGSPECEEKFQQALRAKKRGMWMFVGLILLVMLFSTIGRNYL